MSEAPQSEPSAAGDRPGKTRTLWHPLLVRLLDHALSSAFTVVEEVLVGKMPLRVDILLIRREGKELPEAKRREIAALVPLLNRFTLIEFKGPTDTLERGDFGQLVGCAFLWQSQQDEPIERGEVSLVVLAPAISKPFREELRRLGCEMSQREPGIHCVMGLPFAVWLVETDVMAEHGEPIMSLVSRIFIKDRRRIIDGVVHTDDWVLLQYMVQFFESFGEEAIVHRELSVDPKVVKEEILTAILESVPPERRMQGLPAEERVRGLPPEERVRGLSPEELAAAMSEEQAARLRELLGRNESN